MSQVGVQNSICYTALFLSDSIHNYTHGHRIMYYSNSLFNIHTHHTVTTHTIVTHTHTLTASEPKIKDFQPEVHATAGEQVTLHVNFTGIHKPTITWTFEGNKMEGNYATELGTDGSLLFVCVETKHAERYNS